MLDFMLNNPCSSLGEGVVDSVVLLIRVSYGLVCIPLLICCAIVCVVLVVLVVGKLKVKKHNININNQVTTPQLIIHM